MTTALETNGTNTYDYPMSALRGTNQGTFLEVGDRAVYTGSLVQLWGVTVRVTSTDEWCGKATVVMIDGPCPGEELRSVRFASLRRVLDSTGPGAIRKQKAA
jgi:hypothetical protein